MQLKTVRSMLLALCLGTIAPLALAATDIIDQPTPGSQPHDNGHMNGQGGASGSGTPADGMGTGGTDDNGTDSTGGDGTTEESGSGSDTGTGAGSGSGSGGAGGSGAGSGS
ncbi:hypothetical protein [Pseudomonas oryzicola]|uniref:Uncharacterized protein n=1 Tax=Pseudomonas oryzicola TaxID=485876 RepID=A0ABS6QAI1_9PSED|nr:hypothetical protein [Pseudomonas oryzicola]MBV4491172.1 hypothetical protein [Pseudomonas oryzicola]